MAVNFVMGRQRLSSEEHERSAASAADFVVVIVATLIPVVIDSRASIAVLGNTSSFPIKGPSGMRPFKVISFFFLYFLTLLEYRTAGGNVTMLSDRLQLSQQWLITRLFPPQFR